MHLGVFTPLSKILSHADGVIEGRENLSSPTILPGGTSQLVPTKRLSAAYLHGQNCESRAVRGTQCSLFLREPLVDLQRADFVLNGVENMQVLYCFHHIVVVGEQGAIIAEMFDDFPDRCMGGLGSDAWGELTEI